MTGSQVLRRFGSWRRSPISGRTGLSPVSRAVDHVAAAVGAVVLMARIGSTVLMARIGSTVLMARIGSVVPLGCIGAAVGGVPPTRRWHVGVDLVGLAQLIALLGFFAGRPLSALSGI